MISKGYINLVFLFGLIHCASAQKITDNIEYKDYAWEDSTTISVTPYDSLYDVVFVKDHTIKEWRKSDIFKGERFNFSTMFLFTTIHIRIKLNNDRGVDDYNKMYLPVLSNEEIFEINARAINPDGTVVNFNDSNIRGIDDLEGYGPYKIFAFEGVQVGSELEYFYTIKSVESDYYGTVNVQKEIPILDYKFQIISSNDYVFVSKSYNGLDSLKADSITSEKHGLSVQGLEVEAFEIESFSLDEGLKQRIEYKLETTEIDGDKVYSWQDAADWYARTIYNRPDKAHVKWENKAIKKLLKSVDLTKGLSNLEKIVKIENYVKVEIQLEQYSNVFYAHDIVAKKEYSKLSSVRLFALILKNLGIEHEIVITSNRYKKVFDGELESYSYLNHLLLYLPAEKVFLSPSSETHRIGIVPFGLTNHKGLFIKTIMVGNYVSAFPDVKFIPSGSSALHTDNLDISVKLTNELKDVKATIVRSTTGHCSTSIQPYLPYLSDKQKDNVLKEFFLSIAQNTEVDNVTTENEVISDINKDKPFKVTATVTLNSLLEKAGEKYIFHLGDLIGPQSELYQNKKRKYHISNSYNRQYTRGIEFEIPEGYQVLNAEDFLVNDTLVVDSQKIAQFTSSYELKKGSLHIHIDEYYNQIDIDKKHYPVYRQVINAAADFNKKVLILKRI